VERLAAHGDEYETRRRHAEWCVAFAEAAEPELQRAGGARLMRRLETEHDNIRAALVWCDANAEAHRLMPPLTGALWMFWWQRGLGVEARRWYQRAIEVAEGPRARIGSVRGLALLSGQEGRYLEAATLWDETIALARQLGDDWMLVHALGRRAHTAANI